MAITRFRSMGTSIELLGPAAADARAAAAAVRAVRDAFRREDQRFSRFRDDSELSRVNARARETVHVSAPFADLLTLALEAADETRGLFDPTILPALVAAGYDRNYDEVIAGATAALHPVAPCGRWSEIELRGDHLRAPAGVGIDLGGIAKGWTADLAAVAAVRAGLPWALVNAGGDVRIAGDAPAVTVAVEDPAVQDSECLRLEMSSGAIATSSVLSRPWGEGMHELIDPRTGRPASSDVVQATVWAPTCSRAEVLATLAIIGGTAAAAALPAALVTTEGDLRLAFTRGAVAA